MAFLGRTLLSKPSLSFISFSPLFSSRTFASKALSLPRSSPLLRLRPLLSLSETLRFPAELSGPRLRCFSTRPTTSSLNDPSPNWSNRPPKETILLDGCDFEHWLVVMEPPEPTATRDEIIDSYIKTLATILGSDEEAAKSIYSVSTKHYYAFGCIVSEELSYKIKALPRVRWVLPDSYLDVKNKDYGGEPFIDGKAVPYDPKYHEEWVHNNARANERSRRNDRPRNFDRSRNFERRRENMQNRDFQNRDVPPMPNQGFQSREGQNPMPQNAMPPRDMPPMPNRDFQNHDFNAMPPRDVPNMGGVPNSDAPPSTEYVNRDNRDFQGRDGPNRPNRDFGGMPNREMGGMPGRDYQNQMPNPQTSYMPSGPSYQGGSPGYQGGSAGYQRGGPGFQGGNPGYQGGGPGHEGDAPGNQGGSPSYQGGGSTYQGSGPRYQGRDMPGRDYQ